MSEGCDFTGGCRACILDDKLYVQTEENRYCCLESPGLLESNILKIFMEVADCVRDSVEGSSATAIIATGLAVAAAIIGSGGILYCVWKRRGEPKRDSLYKPMGNLEEEFEMSDLRQTPSYGATTMGRSTGTFMFQSPPTPKRSLAVTIPIPPSLPL